MSVDVNVNVYIDIDIREEGMVDASREDAS